MTMSTRPVVRAGSRAGVVTHVYVTRLDLPNAKRENHLAISTSKPAFWLFAPMYPNGGESHLTAMFHRFRDLISAGSGGSPACSAAKATFGPASRADAAPPQVASSAPAAAVMAMTITSRLIPILLLRRGRALQVCE